VNRGTEKDSKSKSGVGKARYQKTEFVLQKPIVRIRGQIFFAALAVAFQERIDVLHKVGDTAVAEIPD